MSHALLVAGVVIAGVVVLALIAVTVWAWHGELRDARDSLAARELVPVTPEPSRVDPFQVTVHGQVAMV